MPLHDRHKKYPKAGRNRFGQAAVDMSHDPHGKYPKQKAGGLRQGRNRVGWAAASREIGRKVDNHRAKGARKRAV
ncbi:hypothetical protein BY996DRAFT_6487523 [Phakopsora pachyrhizi]|nr:hypothetical protein BY996DRAFT_6487523 [Phakopsora pachyrhizi]